MYEKYDGEYLVKQGKAQHVKVYIVIPPKVDCYSPACYSPAY